MVQQQAVRNVIDVDPARHVQRALTDFLIKLKQPASASTNAEFALAVDSLNRFVLDGGKRIRPTFAWWGWRGAGGDADGPAAEAMLRAASSLELLQACALVHDDLMDDSARRRGAPTIHVEFAARHRAEGWHGEPERFGLAAAVLLGDLALAWADDMFHTAGLPEAGHLAAIEPWQAMRTEVLCGQYLDVLTQARGDESPEAALEIDRLKTAAYTVDRPLHLGAAAAGADPAVLAALRRFGSELGIAFQLRDDLLGVLGDPAVTGKPAGDDLREGKRTLLVALGMQRADATDRTTAAATLRSTLGKADLTESEVDTARQLLVELGAVTEVERRIDRLAAAALDALHSAPIAEPAASALERMVVTVTTRTS